MDIIERAARAVRDARSLPGTKPVATLSDVDRRVARAVLQAIRDPSEAMDEKGQEVCNAAYLEVDEVPADAHFVWQAMIDAALRDTRLSGEA